MNDSIINPFLREYKPMVTSYDIEKNTLILNCICIFAILLIISYFIIRIRSNYPIKNEKKMGLKLKKLKVLK